MARTEYLKLWYMIRLKLLAGELISHEITVVFVRTSNRHFVHGLGRVSKCHRAPIVAGVSRDKLSVSTSTRRTCIVYREASDDDWTF